jgi:hypothetical protein
MLGLDERIFKYAGFFAQEGWEIGIDLSFELAL